MPAGWWPSGVVVIRDKGCEVLEQRLTINDSVYVYRCVFSKSAGYCVAQSVFTDLRRCLCGQYDEISG
jgi:hypothetical protein